MLKIDRISSRYAQVQVLNDVSLEVKDGEVLGLLGRNGAGKSTLLKSIMGLVEVNSGSISLASNSKKRNWLCSPGTAFIFRANC